MSLNMKNINDFTQQKYGSVNVEQVSMDLARFATKLFNSTADNRYSITGLIVGIVHQWWYLLLIADIVH